MTDLRKAAEMALETLCVGANDAVPNDIDERFEQAIQALRLALAQPEQEPFEYWNAVEGWVKIDEVRQHLDSVGCGTIYKTSGENRVPLYTAPPKQEYVTEVVAVHENGTYTTRRTPIQQREWVSLSDEEYDELLTGDWGGSLISRVEAKLKEKNGG